MRIRNVHAITDIGTAQKKDTRAPQSILDSDTSE